MKINICALTDIGKERTNNEDAVSICQDLANPTWSCLSANDYITISSLGAVSIIADGMGGANAGEIASALAIGNIEKSFRNANYENILVSDIGIYTFLKDCIIKSNKAILDFVCKSPDSVGLGTTIVLLWIVNGKAYVAWCGDSRCYCFNPNSGLKLLTKDHSLVQELVDKGEIKTEEAFNHPDNNIITKCLGDVDADPEPEILTYNIEDGDIFMLCSDGLCGYCKDSKIEKVMYKYYDNIDECQRSLLQLALKAGGQDNISISLCATLPESYTTPKVGLLGKMKRFIYKL
ncbi:PP2C family protein-serine/threonine phosphatase [Bacteroides xylanisolvens]|uniref:PP2C family protein-serine/threonine phosphatase n=1 Tax=Bacteroides xylanisolvens TaxID=371601 RepID=UPI0039B62813